MSSQIEQNVNHGYFVGADILTAQEVQPSLIEIDAQAITAQALLKLKSQDETLTTCYDEARAVVICNRDMPDLPIAYVSPGFEVLTGYESSEVLGQNCRFLQRPNSLTPGRVIGPLPAYNGFDPNLPFLRQKIHRGETIHMAIINYHKSGRAFLNGLTIVPIDFHDLPYYVGFQVDVSLQSNASDQSKHSKSFITGREFPISSSLSICCPPSSPGQIRPAFPSNHSSRPSVDTLPSEYAQSTPAPSQADRTGFDTIISMLSCIPGHLLFVICPSGQFRYLSGSVEASLGYLPTQLYRQSFFDILHVQDVSAARADLRKLAPGESHEIICRMVKADGSTVYVDFRASRTFLTSRSFSYVIMSGVQVSGTIVRQPYPLNATAMRNPNLWAKISMSGIILHATSAMHTFLRTTTSNGHLSVAEGIVGLTYQSFLCPRCRTIFEEVLTSMADGSVESVEVQHCLRRSDGIDSVMTSNVLLVEDNLDPTVDTRTHPAFVLVHLSHVNSDDKGAPRPNRRHSKKSAKTTSPSLLCDDVSMTTTTQRSSIRSSSSMLSNLTIQPRSQSRPQPPLEVLTTAKILALTRPLIQTGDNVNSRQFGFDPPEATEALVTMTHLLPQGADFGWQHVVHSLALANQTLKNDLECLRTTLRASRRRKRAKDRNQACTKCGTSDTPEWRRGSSGKRDLCNKCGLRYAKSKDKQSGN